MNDHDHLVDEVLDRALEAYGRGEPLAGLEERVLSALDAERGCRARRSPAGLLGGLRWPAWAGVTAVLVALAVLTGDLLRDEKTGGDPRRAEVPARVLQGGPNEPGATGPDVAAAAPPVPAAAVAATGDRPGDRPRAVPAVQRAPRSPRHSSFPSPAALTEEERFLLLYVSATPREELEARGGFLDEPARLPALPDTGTTP